MSPVASELEPLWQALRVALEQRGYSVRGFAKLCHEADPRMTWESWRRMLQRALEDDPSNPYLPSSATADLWARLLEKPAGYFVRPRQRETEIERLRAENAELRRRLEEAERRANGPT